MRGGLWDSRPARGRFVRGFVVANVWSNPLWTQTRPRAAGPMTRGPECVTRSSSNASPAKAHAPGTFTTAPASSQRKVAISSSSASAILTSDTPPAIVEAAYDSLKRGRTHYTSMVGIEPLREAIAERHRRITGRRVDAGAVVVMAGAQCGLFASMMCLAQPGDEVIVPEPMYVTYEAVVGASGARLVQVPLRCERGFHIDPDDVAAAITPRTRVILMNFPHNPTGAMITHDQLRAWVEYALSINAIILYDVAYAAYISDESLPKTIYEIDGARRCAIEFHSFSKNGGFTGVRCGYTVCPKDVQAVTRKGVQVALHGLWTRRWNTKSNGVSYPVQRGAEAIYSTQGATQVSALVKHYLRNARLLREGCEAAGLTVYGGVHSPYVWVACPGGMDSWGVFDRLLNDAQIVTTPGVGFGSCGEGYFRISAFNSRENTKAAVERLRNVSW